MDEADHPVSINEAQAKEFALFQKGFGVASALHLMGIDHERLTFYHNDIERRLTDVHDHVIHALIA